MTRTYSDEPEDAAAFTSSFDAAYTRLAHAYDVAVRVMPVWKSWLRSVLPHLRGPRVLEVSFGTGYLMTLYADRFETHGCELNGRMVEIARANLRRAGITAPLCRADVAALPYRDGTFNTVVNTMAFSGYPDGRRALAELVRVLEPGGSLVVLDVNYPADGNWAGTRLTEAWKRSGDLIRDMNGLLAQATRAHTDDEVGGCGSVHLYHATK